MIRKWLIAIRIVTLIVLVVFLYAGNEYRKEEKRMATPPYFTESKITISEFSVLYNRYKVDYEPEVDMFSESTYMQSLNHMHWPDYTYYEIQPTEASEKIVTVLNYLLFVERDEKGHYAIDYAEECGFSYENPITTQWIVTCPVEALKLASMVRPVWRVFDDDFLDLYYEEALENMEKN
ncbi:MAG: hypothetical protein R3Y54_10975 [Eubacteriales bacterium]